ncbi:MAG TPA: extracellular solute-binding protein [Pilimelia sp.]|nr:extracellular solute-binding protein [Pilimelia sp.]
MKRNRTILATVLVVALAGCANDTTPVVPAQQALPPGSVAAAVEAARRAADGQQVGGTLNLLGLLSGTNQEQYLKTLRPLEEATGIRIRYETAGDLIAVLRTRVEGGNPPDVVSNPSAGQVRDLAQDGRLVPLDPYLDADAVQKDYPAGLRSLTTVDGKQYGLFVNTALQGLVWYDPKSYDGPKPPATWDALAGWATQKGGGGRAPWCLGLESGPASGWPGAVWIEQFMLQQHGGDAYDRWWQGHLPWTSPEVRAAYQRFGDVATNSKLVSGGPNSALTTNFGESPKGLITDPPACFLHLQADWVGNAMVAAMPGTVAVEDIDFFPFPSLNAGASGSIEITGEVLGAFRDNPQVRAFMRYVSTPEFSALVATTGLWLGANSRTPVSAYPSVLSRHAAQVYAAAKDVRFGAKDAMPAAMSQAFLKSVMDYVRSPDKLDTILAGLERTRQSAYR